MNRIFHILLILSAIGIALAGVYLQILWLEVMGRIFVILPLLILYKKRLPSKSLNFLAFSVCLFLAAISSFWKDIWMFDQLVLGLWLAIYIFLGREAFKYTEYVKGSRFTNVCFGLILGLYAYLLLLHVVEIEQALPSDVDLVLYIIYYVSILIFAGTALVYYLNSFSRKSVFFICLALSFVFADILRDMELFYLPDLSVEIVSMLLNFTAIQLTFLFFITPEKKLRLLHLI